MPFDIKTFNFSCQSERPWTEEEKQQEIAYMEEWLSSEEYARLAEPWNFPKKD